MEKLADDGNGGVCTEKKKLWTDTRWSTVQKNKRSHKEDNVTLRKCSFVHRTTWF